MRIYYFNIRDNYCFNLIIVTWKDKILQFFFHMMQSWNETISYFQSIAMFLSNCLCITCIVSRQRLPDLLFQLLNIKQGASPFSLSFVSTSTNKVYWRLVSKFRGLFDKRKFNFQLFKNLNKARGYHEDFERVGVAVAPLYSRT